MGLVEPLLCVLATTLAELAQMTKQILAIVRGEPVCRLTGVPGVEPITALAFRTMIDDRDRFQHSSYVGTQLSHTPARYQSGETDITGWIVAAATNRRGLRF